MFHLLSQYFQIHRRYYRSVNLERDLYNPDAVEGYVLTERSSETLARIFPSFSKKETHRAWTLTGVYGTGKSAFAHYLASLCAGKRFAVHDKAVHIIEHFLVEDETILTAIDRLPKSGLVIAVATGQQEPLTWTLARALADGADQFFTRKQQGASLLMRLHDWKFQAEDGKCQAKPQDILQVIQELVTKAKTHLLFIVDELGKNLEYANHHQGKEDLYLLQQIAELSLKGDHQVYFIGLLHQSFTGYSDRLSITEQNEWNKIQGRFVDIPFTELPSQMTRLIAQVIDRQKADFLLPRIQDWAKEWYSVLEEMIPQDITAELLENIYPLHPLTALILPLLCTRYAQNDRSLFTFLTSDEPHSFKEFLTESTPTHQWLPTLNIHKLYDYFVETVAGLASRLNFQRWVEIKGLIEEAQGQSLDVLKILKTIGIFNLITTAGNYRATGDLVAWALCDRADETEKQYWLNKIDQLKEKGLISHRGKSGELRLWQGSDFDIEKAIANYIEQNRQNRASISNLLSKIYPLKPLVTQRHYVRTGTLRYFEQRYGDSRIEWTKLNCSDASYDGLILYWLDRSFPENIPSHTVDTKPLIIVKIEDYELLQKRGEELQALRTIATQETMLQNDGVARREVRYHWVEAQRLLDEAIVHALNWSTGKNDCWIAGAKVNISSTRIFQSKLSDLCDRIYHKGMILENELINRRELTGQGTKARRELITAMIEKGDRPRLDLEGYGPEVAMYASVLQATGIHQLLSQEEAFEGERWGFVPPFQDSGLITIWQAIETFCTTAKDQVRSLDQLYRELEQAPYGVKVGIIPILFAAVLLHHIDDVGIYQDGTYIPVLGVEHFEILVRYPQRFAIKSFAIAGLRSQVFKELEGVLKSPNLKAVKSMRNTTLLTVVTPLYQFAKKLPPYTQQTQHISRESQNILKTLQKTIEPDELLFIHLPQALGLEPIQEEGDDHQTAKAQELRSRLVNALREIHGAYDVLLTESKQLIYKAFGIRSEVTQLREDLRVRANYLVNHCIEPMLKRFMLAAVNQKLDDRLWLESLLMIVSDKPAVAWIDEDVTAFEVNLANLARRFRNLEALQKEVEAKGEGFEARRITMTHPNGQEANMVVWVDHQHKDIAQDLLTKMLEELGDVDRQTQQAVLIQITEKLLASVDPENIAQLADYRQEKPKRKAK